MTVGGKANTLDVRVSVLSVKLLATKCGELKKENLHARKDSNSAAASDEIKRAWANVCIWLWDIECGAEILFLVANLPINNHMCDRQLLEDSQGCQVPVGDCIDISVLSRRFSTTGNGLSSGS